MSIKLFYSAPLTLHASVQAGLSLCDFLTQSDTCAPLLPSVCPCRLPHGAVHPAMYHHAWQAAHPEQPVWDRHTVSGEHTRHSVSWQLFSHDAKHMFLFDKQRLSIHGFGKCWAWDKRNNVNSFGHAWSGNETTPCLCLTTSTCMFFYSSMSKQKLHNHNMHYLYSLCTEEKKSRTGC